MNSIFSTYSTGENRVTASFLAVLRSLSLDRIQRLLGALLEQSEFELVKFENQHTHEGKGVPDAIIQCSARIFIETKIAHNAVKVPQLKRHLEALDQANEKSAHLLVITPDNHLPAAIVQLSDSRLAWASFTALDQAIDEILDDKYEVVSEREEFLLREFQNMLMQEQLIASENDVVIVAARNAWPEYNQYHAYVCQPNRTFQLVNRLGFYSDGQVYRLVPKILESHPEVLMKKGMHKGTLGSLVDKLIDDKLRPVGESFMVMLLSEPQSPNTLQLPKPIPNDVKSSTGRGWAFTLGQRYVSTEALIRAKSTSELLEKKL